MTSRFGLPTDLAFGLCNRFWAYSISVQPTRLSTSPADSAHVELAHSTLPLKLNLSTTPSVSKSTLEALLTSHIVAISVPLDPSTSLYRCLFWLHPCPPGPHMIWLVQIKFLERIGCPRFVPALVHIGFL